MSSINYESGRGFFNTGERRDFHSGTRRALACGEDQNICHRVSYKFMTEALVNAANFFWYNANRCWEEQDAFNYMNLVKQETMYYIMGIIMGVSMDQKEQSCLINECNQNVPEILKNESEDLDTQIHYFANQQFLTILKQRKDKTYLTYYITIQEVLEAIIGEVTKEDDEKDVESIEESWSKLKDLLENLSDCLNNDQNNLFLGNQHWNKSIGECFDSMEPVIDLGEGRLQLNDFDSLVFSILVESTKGGGENFDESGLSIYAGIDQNGKMVLYSSTHDEKLPNIKIMQDEIIIVYFNFFRNDCMSVV